jgi:hypothetical protein
MKSVKIPTIPDWSNARRAPPRVQTRSGPERDDAGQGNGRSEVGSELVIARCDTAEVLQAAERRLDAPPILVAGEIVLDLVLARAPTGDDRRGACGFQVGAQPIGVVTTIGDEPAQASRDSGDDLRGDRYIAGVARGEVDDRRPADDVCDDVNFSRLPSSRDADGLCLRPPLPPWAERCALM